MSLERVILSQLTSNDEYARKVTPYLKEEYFSDLSEKTLFILIDEYIKKYNKVPAKTELKIELDGKEGLHEQVFERAKECLSELVSEDLDPQWLLDSTEQFCKDKALSNAINQAIQIYDDKSGKLSTGAIPEIIREALSVSFDTTIGHDFLEEAEARYEFYHKVECKKPFHLEYFNRITRGGLVSKTLTIAIAGTGVGKSLLMCDFASADLMAGYNVLYLTMEMAEEKIAERIDANLCDIELDKLEGLKKDEYLGLITHVKSKTRGKLVIKEYPNGSVHAGHFRYLLRELELKKRFKPDIVYVDYLNIIASSRLKRANSGMYEYIKSIAEELRELAQEFDIPVFSATQTNRDGIGSSDVDLSNTSESIGLPMTVDLMFALMQPEEFATKGQFLVKQLKNRYRDESKDRRFVIGVDKAKMRLYDVEQAAQTGIMDGPVISNSTPSFAKSEQSYEGWS